MIYLFLNLGWIKGTLNHNAIVTSVYSNIIAGAAQIRTQRQLTRKQLCILWLLITHLFDKCLWYSWAFLVAQTIKNPPAMQEILVWSLSWEDPFEEEIATNSGILAWRIPWTEEHGRLQSMELQRVGHDWALTHNSYSTLSCNILSSVY